MAFCWLFVLYVAELLWKKKVVYSEKDICWKYASEEGECWNVMQNMVCSFGYLVVWASSITINIYIYIYKNNDVVSSNLVRKSAW